MDPVNGLCKGRGAHAKGGHGRWGADRKCIAEGVDTLLEAAQRAARWQEEDNHRGLPGPGRPTIANHPSAR